MARKPTTPKPEPFDEAKYRELTYLQPADPEAEKKAQAEFWASPEGKALKRKRQREANAEAWPDAPGADDQADDETDDGAQA